MMHVVEQVALKVILVATVAGGRAQQEVNTVPEEGIGTAVEEETGGNTGIVVQMLYRMHTEARKRFYIGIAVVQTVNLLIQRSEVEKAMSKVEVDAAPNRYSRKGSQKIPGTLGIRKTTGCPQETEDIFVGRPDDSSRKSPKGIVKDLVEIVLAVLDEGSRTHTKKEE